MNDSYKKKLARCKRFGIEFLDETPNEEEEAIEVEEDLERSRELYEKLCEEAKEIENDEKLVEKLPKIVKTKGTCGGRPVIEGTRIQVEWLLGHWARGSDHVDKMLDGREYYFGKEDHYFEAAILCGSKHKKVRTWGLGCMSFQVPDEDLPEYYRKLRQSLK